MTVGRVKVCNGIRCGRWSEEESVWPIRFAARLDGGLVTGWRRPEKWM